VDLGVTASISENNKVRGTFPYISPEQLRGEQSDPRSDIFSDCVVLYELAMGRRPFPSSHVPVLIESILNRDPEPPSVLNPKISPGLEMVILKCLDKEPERRYMQSPESMQGTDLRSPLETNDRLAAEWQIGQRFGGRWDIQQILRGGMGIVYIVYDHWSREQQPSSSIN
jgi:serine/threonine protein kinase